MDFAINLLLTWFATYISSSKEPMIKLTRTSSDEQVKEAERQALYQYGVKAEINVINRNPKGEITNLRCTRYASSGKQDSGCSSDDFGVLVITRDGCKIADSGHEEQI